MRILVLGGTVFLGRHIVAAALERGHQVSIFTRGISNPDLFPEVEKLRGDRDGNLAALCGRQFDAVIDVNGYVPRVVRASLDLLTHATNHYTFISTISVYKDFRQFNMDEAAAVAKVDDEFTEDISTHYGELKALCEKAVQEAMPKRSLVIRPGIIVGPYDQTDRFTYWPERISRGGEVLAPGRPNRQIQFIDVRDLADWTVRMVERQATGVFNATGPKEKLTMLRFLEQANEELGGHATFTWVDDDFLAEQNVRPWTELPLWIPDSGPFVEQNGPMGGMLAVSVDKAVEAGLTFRPIAETVRDTLTWSQTREGAERKAGMTAEREAEVLAAYHARER